MKQSWNCSLQSNPQLALEDKRPRIDHVTRSSWMSSDALKQFTAPNDLKLEKIYKNTNYVTVRHQNTPEKRPQKLEPIG